MRTVSLFCLCISVGLTMGSLEGKVKKATLQREKVHQKWKNLKAEVSLLNLLNGLHLSASQMRQLYRELLCLREHRRVFLEKERKLLAPSAKRLSEIYRALLANKGVAMTYRQVLQHQWRKWRKLKQWLQEVEKKHAWNIQKLLSPTQREALRHFSPCIVPPPSFQNPVRIGQAMDLSKAVELLKKYRKADPKKRARMEIRFYRRLRKQIEKKAGTLDEGLFRKEWKRIQKVLQKVISLSDLEFELQKNRLAKEVRFHNPLKELKKKVDKLRREEEKKSGQESLIPQIRFLLDLRLLPLLEVKYEKLVNYKKKLTDLRKIRGVENCKTCAVD